MVRLSVQDIEGVFALMPTPATEDASDWRSSMTVDLVETERATHALVDAGVDAIMTTGTFGEAATLTWEEHKAFAEVVVETVSNRLPVIVGPTTLNTRDTITRGRYFADIGASGFLLGRPMWVKCDETATVSYYSDVAEALPEMAIIVYDNPVAFKGKLSRSAYRELSKLEQVVAAKYAILGSDYPSDVDAVGDRMRLLPIDQDWWYARQWRPDNALACWSSAASCGPSPCIALRDALASNDGESAKAITERMREASATLFPDGDFETFAKYNIGLGKARIDAAGFINAGPVRPPYHQVPRAYLEGAAEAGERWKILHQEYASQQAKV